MTAKELLRIAFLTEMPFSSRDYERFGLELFSKNLVAAAVDFTPWINPHIWKEYSSIVYKFREYRAIFCRDEFKRLLQEARFDFVIDTLGRSRRAEEIRRTFKEMGVPIVALVTGLLPPLPRKSVFENIRALKYRTHRTELLFRWLMNALARMRGREVTPDIALMSGTASNDMAITKGARKIWAHSLDYDIYLLLRDGHPKNVNPYVVYIDQDFAFHSDFVYHHEKPFVRPETFYPALMEFFRAFESATGIKVVIAAHPRAQWGQRLHLLEDRTPIYNRTAELIRDSQMVFAHASTSISFAVLFRKPLIFLTSDQLIDSRHGEEILIRSHLFHAPLINLNRVGNPDFTSWNRCDERTYEEYRNKYIKKSGTEDLLLWQIFINAISDG